MSRSVSGGFKGQIYADVWKHFIEEMDRHAALMVEVHTIERQGGVNRDYCVFDDDDFDVFKEVDEKGKKIFDRLVYYAERAFAPPGGKLEIKDHDLREKFIGRFADRDREEDYETLKQKAMKGWRKFDPAKIWDELDRRYGGNNGVEIGYQQTAKDIISFFRIKTGEAVEVKAGSIVLDVRVWSERRFQGGMELGNGSQEEIIKGLQNIATLAEWAEDGRAANGLRRFANEIPHNRQINSRARIQVSESITVITYFNRFEFRFAPDFAGKLQQFISTYARTTTSKAA